MRALVLFCCLVMVAAQDKYSDKYDINLKETLNNKKLLEPYLNCLLNKGACNAHAQELRSHLKEAIQTGCSKCTNKQKDGALKVLEHLVKKEPQLWHQVVTKYDPKNEYRQKYEALAREKGIEIPK